MADAISVSRNSVTEKKFQHIRTRLYMQTNINLRAVKIEVKQVHDNKSRPYNKINSYM